MKDANAQGIQHLFETQVERTPDTIALIQSHNQLTYQELNEQANQLAHHLQSLGVGPECLVGLYLERSTEAIIGILAILKAGGAYVPLDPAYPSERLAFMVSDASLSFVITHSSLMTQIASWNPLLSSAQQELVLIDALSNKLRQLPTHNPVGHTMPDRLAYIIYTSGSTGRPKGVQGLHRGMVNFLAWMWQTYPFSSGEVCCQKTSLNFVDSIWEIFWPLAQGVPLVIIPDHTLKDITNFIQTLNNFKVTRLVVVPSLLATMLELVDLDEQLPHLNFWVTSGEALSVTRCRRFYEQMPNGTLLNLYGSSEVSANASWYDTRAFDETLTSVPIGQPLRHTTLHILDDEQNPLPIGTVGQLYVGGEGLARGYLNQPALTEKAFMPNPFGPGRLYKTGDQACFVVDSQENVLLEFLGRVDHQVKIRGMRVELPEIEKTLLQHPAVRDCVVTFNPNQSGHKQFVAYVVAQTETQAETQAEMQAETQAETQTEMQTGAQADVFATECSRALRDFLQDRLPEYMIPTGFVCLDALPLTPNGKVNRLALPAFQYEPVVPYVAPQTKMEIMLATLWQDVLNVEQVGIHERFFDAGGDSLLLIQLHTKLSQAIEANETNIPMIDLLRFPTIASQASYLMGAEEKPLADIEIVPLDTASLAETIQLVTAVFSEREVVNVSSGITEEDFYPIAKNICTWVVKDGLSLIAKNKKTDAVVGFSICQDFMAEPDEEFDEISPKVEPVLALLGEMDEQYKTKHPGLKQGDLLYVFFNGTHHNYLGVGGLLQIETSKLAHEKGYRGLVSSDTGKTSQALSALDGFETMVEIHYDSFTYQNRTPFSHIKEPPSCKLMVKLI
ncbi:MAG: non-ribosomal peptide synthetase [Chloroflexota bacterium]